MNEPEGTPAPELSPTDTTAPPVPSAPETPVPTPLSAGQQLQTAREAAGLSLDALAQTLKVAVGKLEALEAGRLDALPSPMFARALASSVCRVLGIDAAPVLGQLPQSDQYAFERGQSNLNAPFRTNPVRPMVLVARQLKNPFALLVLALLVGALALFLVPSIPPLDNLVGRLKEGASAPANTTPSVALGNTVTVDVTPTPGTPKTPQPTVAASDVLLPSLTPASSLTPAPASATVAPAGVLGFKARTEVWIEVTDAKGRTPLRRLVAPGETVQVDGSLPLSVTVGRADAVEVLVRGQPFDLAARTRDNVARFEVK